MSVVMNKLIIANDLQRRQDDLKATKVAYDCLIVKTVNNWVEDAKSRPIPNMLFSELWYENELAILFADTNLGKSILAVQIADSLSKGIAIQGFKLECKPKKVLYLDFELSDKQFENRYSANYTAHYTFDSLFKRAELNPELNLPKEFKTIEDYLCATLETTIISNGTEVLIIDNLTYLNSDSEKAKYALNLMKLLKQITKSTTVSILVLAHTPKRDNSVPLTKNDLAGSKMLMNFCDSCFAIGASTLEVSQRYIKQIKQRNTEHIYHGDNVILCEIKKDFNFLEFQFLEFANERDHLKSVTTDSIHIRDAKMIDLIQQGKTNVDIGKELGLSEGAIRKRRNKLNC